MNRSIRTAAIAVALAIFAVPVQAHEAGKWVLRAGIGTVAPKSTNLDLSDAVDTTLVKVDDGTSLTLTGTYMMTENWAFDVLAAWPFSHDINLSVNGESAKIAETDHLPPTFSVQYHFAPDSQFEPYVGVGVNYTTFFNTKTVGDLSSAGFDLDDSFGLAGQVGADVNFGSNWLLNVDVRYIDIGTDAKLGGAKIGEVEINPWVYSINLGYRFE